MEEPKRDMWGLDLKAFGRQIREHLALYQDGTDTDCARYDSPTKRTAVNDILETLRPMLFQSLYACDEDGEPLI